MATIYPNSFIIFTTILLIIISHAYSFKNGGITFDLIHRDSINTNDHNNRITNLRNAFRRSFARRRAHSLATSHHVSSSSSPSASSDSNFNATLTSGYGEYLMTVKIGTPPVEITVIADTGSDLTWTQCAPCNDCYDQSQPLFDPNKTSTYSQVPCSAALCSDEGLEGSCSDSEQCLYNITYVDGSYTEGDVASETFTFDSDSGDQSLTIPNVVFGCGREDVGTFPNTSSGIIGLSGSNVSIIRQLDSYINGRFSYCLTSYDSTAASKISFGSNAVVSGPNVVSTPLVSGDNYTTLYFVTLQGITVGDQKFVVSPNNNNQKNAGDAVQKGNMIVDSGTTVTFISESLYESVESAVVNQTTGTQVADPFGEFDLCYDASKDINPPKIVANFDGADVVLPENGIFIELIEEGIACFTLVSWGSDDYLGIFGNLHQMNYHVGFDLKKQQLSFAPTDCSKGQ